MYLITIPIIADSAYSTNDAVLPADAPSGIYEITYGLSNIENMTIILYNQGTGNNRPETLKALENSKPPIAINNGSTGEPIIDFWSYEPETNISTYATSGKKTILQLSGYIHHIQGEETRLTRFSSSGSFTTGSTINTIVVKRIS